MTATAVLIAEAGHAVAPDLRAALAVTGRRLRAGDAAAAARADLVVDARPLAGASAMPDWERLDALARACAAGRGPDSAGSLVVLLPAGPPGAARHERQAAAARLRALALAAAPGLRVNAIGVGADAAAVGSALRLIVAAPTMTGQMIWLDGRVGHRAVETAAVALPAAAFPASDRPPSGAAEAPALRRMFIRDLVLACRIGVYRHERLGAQRVRINVDLDVRETAGPGEDRLEAVVCYDRIAAGIRRVVAAEHVNLVETLAERIAEVCLEDPRVATARVRVEKLDLYADAVSAGVELERRNRNRL